MSGDGTKIELVYEPGFGSMGSAKENTLVESPIGLYRLSEKKKADYQKMLDNSRVDGTPRDVIFFVKDKTYFPQALVALIYSAKDLSTNPNFPTINKRKDTPDGYSITNHSALGAYNPSDGYTQSNKEAGVDLPLDNLILYQTTGVSNEDYVKGRRMLIDKANETLQIFEAKFRIPQFPPDDKLREI